MEQTDKSTNFRVKISGSSGKTKRFADGSETAIRIPPVVKPVEVEAALRAVPVEARHIAIAIGILPDRNVQDIAHTTIP